MREVTFLPAFPVNALYTLRGAADAAVKRGVFGVPTFLVGEDFHWGHDRMRQVARAAAAP